jgi:hypothetical protein
MSRRWDHLAEKAADSCRDYFEKQAESLARERWIQPGPGKKAADDFSFWYLKRGDALMRALLLTLVRDEQFTQMPEGARAALLHDFTRKKWEYLAHVGGSCLVLHTFLSQSDTAGIVRYLPGLVQDVRKRPGLAPMLEEWFGEASRTPGSLSDRTFEAMFLHDAGKLLPSVGMTTDRARALKAGETGFSCRHDNLGAELLRSVQRAFPDLGLGDEAVLFAAGHHRKAWAPDSDRIQSLPPAEKVFFGLGSAADVYDSMVSIRGYKGQGNALLAAAEMYRGPRGIDDGIVRTGYVLHRIFGLCMSGVSVIPEDMVHLLGAGELARCEGIVEGSHGTRARMRIVTSLSAPERIRPGGLRMVPLEKVVWSWPEMDASIPGFCAESLKAGVLGLRTETGSCPDRNRDGLAQAWIAVHGTHGREVSGAAVLVEKAPGVAKDLKARFAKEDEESFIRVLSAFPYVDFDIFSHVWNALGRESLTEGALRERYRKAGSREGYLGNLLPDRGPHQARKLSAGLAARWFAAATAAGLFPNERAREEAEKAYRKFGVSDFLNFDEIPRIVRERRGWWVMKEQLPEANAQQLRESEELVLGMRLVFGYIMKRIDILSLPKLIFLVHDLGKMIQRFTEWEIHCKPEVQKDAVSLGPLVRRACAQVEMIRPLSLLRAFTPEIVEALAVEEGLSLSSSAVCEMFEKLVQNRGIQGEEGEGACLADDLPAGMDPGDRVEVQKLLGILDDLMNRSLRENRTEQAVLYMDLRNSLEEDKALWPGTSAFFETWEGSGSRETVELIR